MSFAPAPAPAPALADEEDLTGEVVTSSEVVTSVAVSAITGALFLTLWIVFRTPLRHIFEKRTQLDEPARPPPLRHGGLLARCTSYITPVFLVSDLEFVQTAGLDALILVRFLALGLQIMLPLAVVCCAVLLPLCMTGTYASTSYAANLAGIMRYTLSNIQPASPKLWAPFALSYGVLAWVCYCLVQHYKSYAVLRLLYLRHNTADVPGAAPRQAIVGFEPRGWAAVRDSLLALCSPLYMLRRDMRYVRVYLEACAAAEAAAAADEAEGLGKGEGGGLGKGDDSGSDDPGGLEYAQAAVLPWWLPPERVPAACSVERSTSSVLHGRACAANLKRVFTTDGAGRPVWVSAEQYAVLYTIAGPPPSRELWRLLRPVASAPAGGVLVEHPGARRRRGEGDEDEARAELSAASRAVLAAPDGGQAAGQGAEFVAQQLRQALEELFPGALTALVRVHNHKATDVLLGKHDLAATRRDRCAFDLEAARRAAKSEGAPERRRAGAEAAAAKAEAALAAAEEEVARLEREVEEARAAALANPLGTAFIALFRDQATAALAGGASQSLVPGINFNVRPCPGPDGINWMALWTTWGGRILRGLCVLPFLVLVMLFPIGVLTGALTNLSTAVCGGTSDTNKLYWPWYCEQTSFGAKLLKGLLEGVLPSTISMLWDTYVLPMAFFFSSQSEARHLALADMDHRVLTLFFNFDVFNTFLGSVMGGAIFQQAGSLASQPGFWLQQLGAALPTASTFFLNYIIIHALSTNFFRFIWPHEGTVLFVIFRWLGMARPKCERDHCMIRTAPSYRGARHFGSFVLIQIMALTYAVIAPLVLPAAVVFFFTAWVAWRYCALYFYERSYEAGGRIWETLFSLMVWVLLLFSLFTSLVLASKKAWTQALIVLFTQWPLLLMFHKRVTLTIAAYARSLPLQALAAAPRAVVDPAAYLPPPLRRQAVGWQPEWGKLWVKYGISRYSL